MDDDVPVPEGVADIKWQGNKGRVMAQAPLRSGSSSLRNGIALCL